MKNTLKGKIINGTLEYYSPINYNNALQRYNGDVTIVISDNKSRSNNQNSLLWRIYKEISDYAGYSTVEFHNYFKELYAPKKGQLEIPRSTSDLTSSEMTDYLNNIRSWCNDKIGFLPSAFNEPGIEGLVC